MSLNPIDLDHYARQLNRKVERLGEQFAEFNPPALTVYPSPPRHFRQRAEFRIWHQGDDSFYAMFHPEQPKTPVRVDEFPAGSQTINQLMTPLMEAIKASDGLRRKLFQIEFLTTLSGQALVTLIYHRPLDEAWHREAVALQATLGIKLIGRSRKQKWVLDEDFVTETLTVAERDYHFQQVENSFTQPNARVNQSMLTWALDKTQSSDGDLLELYCGNGNFTVVLAQHFRRVLATEISKTSVKSAQHNLAINGVPNTTIVRLSSEEFATALDGERAFRRLRDVNLNEYAFSTVLVDPPRAGLDAHTEQIVARFDRILYISCNPATLRANLLNLAATHRIRAFALFDQFPYTDHIECGVMLERRQ